MRVSLQSVLIAAVLVVSGCTAIRDAREAQRNYAGLGDDAYYVAVTNHIDLSTYTLSQLVDYAMTNRPTVVRYALAVEDARLALKQLRSQAPVISETPWLAPKLSVAGGYSAASESDSHLRMETEGTAAGSVSLSIPLYDFGRHDAAVRKQCEAVLDSELNLVNEGYQVFYDVASSYFSLLESCALLAVAHTNETEFAAHLELATRRWEAGDATDVDVMRARLDLAQAKERIVTIQCDVDTCGAELLKALGVDASYGTRRAVIDFRGDPLNFVMRGFPETDYSVQDAFALARTNSPSMRIVRSRLRGASADVDYAVADLLPELTASASLNWSDPLWAWNWGVSAAQTLFTGFRKRTAVDRAVIALRQAAADVAEEELAISLNLEKAVALRDTSRKSMETAAVSLHEAKINLEQCRQQYLVGDVSRIEYTAAVNSYTTAMGKCISAFYQEQRAESAIFSLTGVYPVYEEKKLTEITK